MNTEFY